MKIKEPKLRKELYKDMPEGMEFSDTYFEEFPFGEVKDVTFDGCVFNRIDFSNVNLEDVSLTDCRFDNCDLSNKCFDKMFITRCEFINSKMVGTSFIGAVLKDVKFSLVKGDYINFSGARLSNVLFEEANLSYGYFSESVMKNVYFDKANLTNVMFYKVSHDDLDLSNSTLDGIIIDASFLRGVIINTFQAADLISFFGVSVRGGYGDS